jgi:hypothetical protein
MNRFYEILGMIEAVALRVGLLVVMLAALVAFIRRVVHL